MNYEDIKGQFQENFFQINMLLSLIKELKTLNYSIKNNEIYIFFHKDNQENTSNKLSLMNYKNTNEKIISVCIGGEYEFKKLEINNNSISVYLANENGKFILNNIPYDNIVGFYNNRKFIKYYDIFNTKTISLQDLENSVLNKINSEKEKYSYIFTYTIEKTILDIINNGLGENQILKITFVDKNSSVNEKYKFITVLLEDDDWEIELDNDIIYLEINNNQQSENIEIPIKNIMSFIDTGNLIFFNKYLKFVEEDFQDIDLNVYNQENLFFVDFNNLLEEEITNEITNLFKNDSLFVFNNTNKNTTKKKKDKNTEEDSENNLNNLIIGNFEVKEKDKKD
jgi:hypothetical protein